MSTFDGIVKEFPDIRIDYFRPSSENCRPPLAYFLSHVHSDHLVGLESCKSPFIYCSPATREILLRLEKYPHRMNFAKGILETRKQTYQHLKKLLKPIPLETPTTIELSPSRSVRVTLFDANHCVGAVSFLIEGDGKTIIYTGDVRCESWWVQSLCRNPLLLPYVPSIANSGKPVRALDCIYLDTTFASKDDPYRQFPSKAEGLSELLHAVSKYPSDTLFYFDSWTFGYEDVWQTLSAFLGTRIHVDDYRYGLYRALANAPEPKAAEAFKLIGFQCGNHYQKGCLTPHSSHRLHSCEKGTGCDIWEKDFVRITPIISRHNGMEMAELGAGGGQGDLDQAHELETSDAGVVGQLMALCASKLSNQPQQLVSIMQLLMSLINDHATTVSLAGSGLIEDFARAAEADGYEDVNEVPLERLVPALSKLATKSKQTTADKSLMSEVPSASRTRSGLPKRITFPYSRHASYAELCDLISAFRPKDIHPCTVDRANWSSAQSMAFLFGHIYSRPPNFTHDQMMLRKHRLPAIETGPQPIRSTPEASPERRRPSECRPPVNYDAMRSPIEAQHAREEHYQGRRDVWPPQETDHYSPPRESRSRRSGKRKSAARSPSRERSGEDHGGDDASAAFSDAGLDARRASFQAKIGAALLGADRREEQSHRTKRLRCDSDAPEYGRLSPVPGAVMHGLPIGPQRLPDRATIREESPDTAAVEALRRAAIPFGDLIDTRPGRHRLMRDTAGATIAVDGMDELLQRYKRRRNNNAHTVEAQPESTPSPLTGTEAPLDESTPRLHKGTEERRDTLVTEPLIEPERSTRLYIRNVAYTTTEAGLAECFQDYSAEQVDIPMNPRTSRPTGYAFIDVATSAEAKRAVREMDGQELDGRKISVQFARMPTPVREDVVPTVEHEETGYHEDLPEYRQLSAEEARLALRQEAYEAALSEGGMNWSRISLLSTGGGHQVKEEEL